MNREDILALARRPRQVTPVIVPGVGTFHVRSMTGLERERLENKIAGKEVIDARARICAAAMCDESGQKLLFGEFDLPDLNALDWRILNAVKNAVEDMNGMTPSAVEDAVKNSEGASSAPTP